MTVVVPNALALAGIVDGSSIVASDHRNNYAATQVGVNGLIAMFTNAPTKGDLIVSAGAGSFDRLGVGINGQTVVADSSQPLGVKWGGGAPYRKTTAKAVNTTVAATDLLNGEITLAAGILGLTGMLRLTAWGDWLQNTGGAAAAPRFQLLLGGTTIFDTGAGPSVATSVTRAGWKVVVDILNLGVANSQSADFSLDIGSAGGFAATAANFTTGTGTYSSVYDGAVAVLAKALGVTTSAVNTALAAALVLNVINGSALATYETKLTGALVEVI